MAFHFHDSFKECTRFDPSCCSSPAKVGDTRERACGRAWRVRRACQTCPGLPSLRPTHIVAATTRGLSQVRPTRSRRLASFKLSVLGTETSALSQRDRINRARFASKEPPSPLQEGRADTPAMVPKAGFGTMRLRRPYFLFLCCFSDRPYLSRHLLE